jgi:hypothetical protein
MQGQMDSTARVLAPHSPARRPGAAERPGWRAHIARTGLSIE